MSFKYEEALKKEIAVKEHSIESTKKDTEWMKKQIISEKANIKKGWKKLAGLAGMLISAIVVSGISSAVLFAYTTLGFWPAAIIGGLITIAPGAYAGWKSVDVMYQIIEARDDKKHYETMIETHEQSVEKGYKEIEFLKSLTPDELAEYLSLESRFDRWDYMDKKYSTKKTLTQEKQTTVKEVVDSVFKSKGKNKSKAKDDDRGLAD